MSTLEDVQSALTAANAKLDVVVPALADIKTETDRIRDLVLALHADGGDQETIDALTASADSLNEKLETLSTGLTEVATEEKEIV